VSWHFLLIAEERHENLGQNSRSSGLYFNPRTSTVNKVYCYIIGDYCRQLCTASRFWLKRAASSLRCRWWPSVAQPICVRQMSPISGFKPRALTREHDLSEPLLRECLSRTSIRISVCRGQHHLSRRRQETCVITGHSRRAFVS
jgi:hypothetical protein